MTPKLTHDELDAVEDTINFIAGHEAPADGLAYGAHILRFADLASLLAQARAAEVLAAKLEELIADVCKFVDRGDEWAAVIAANDALATYRSLAKDR